jgi:adhesin transport system outer membrane protein
LFDGLRKNFQTEGAENDKAVANTTLRASTQNAIFEGVSAYFDILRQTRLFDLIRVNEQAVEQQFQLEEERVEAGAGLAVDLLIARSQLQLAKERRAIFNGNLQKALSRYRQVFGDAPNIGALTVPVPPIDLLPTTVEEAIKISFGVNPNLESTNNLVDSSRARQRAAAADFYPRLDLIGAANFEENVNSTPGIRRDWSILFTATWNLFSGFATQANVAGASFDHAASLNALHMANRRVEEDIRVSWQGLLTGCERRFLLENAVSISLDVLDSRQRLQEAGQETALRVLQAETEVFNAQINLAQTSFDEIVTVYRMMLALGKLEAVTLLNATTDAQQEGATTSLVDWCRQYAELDLRGDEDFLKSRPTDIDDHPFASRDDGAGDDADLDALFGDDEDGDEEDVFESFFEDDDEDQNSDDGGFLAPEQNDFELQDAGLSENQPPATTEFTLAEDDTISADDDADGLDPALRRRLQSYF